MLIYETSLMSFFPFSWWLIGDKKIHERQQLEYCNLQNWAHDVVHSTIALLGNANPVIVSDLFIGTWTRFDCSKDNKRPLGVFTILHG